MNVIVLWSSHVSIVETLDQKSRVLDQLADRAVQATASGEVLPCRDQAILPPPHTRLRSAAVLDGRYLCLLTTQALESMGAGRLRAVVPKRQKKVAMWRYHYRIEVVRAAVPCGAAEGFDLNTRCCLH